MPLICKDEAVKKLKQNQLVALPTETVYGLAGRIDSETSLKSIFSTKARPFFDPLIIHVKDVEQAQSFAFFDELNLSLAQAFWPGPLTLVLPKKETVSDLITNGGPTVALRVPNHPIFLDILKQLASPLAAPSANMFGQTSPTTAQHVVDEFSDTVSVVDGGHCEKGIESTVVQYDPEQNKLFILRAGMTSKNDLEVFTLKKNLSFSVEFKAQDNSPGHLKNHYQPKSPLFLVKGSSLKTLPTDVLNTLSEKCSSPVAHWTLPESPSLAARQLYSDLREYSQADQACYVIVPPEWENHDQWQGLLDRLQKAAHYLVSYSDGQWSVTAKN